MKQALLFGCDEMRCTEETLHGVREELEKRIEERTAELAEANAQLRQEISERKKVEAALRESEEKRPPSDLDALSASLYRIELQP